MSTNIVSEGDNGPMGVLFSLCVVFPIDTVIYSFHPPHVSFSLSHRLSRLSSLRVHPKIQYIVPVTSHRGISPCYPPSSINPMKKEKMAFSNTSRAEARNAKLFLNTSVKVALVYYN